MWNHGGLVCGLDAKVIDAAGRRCGAEIISIDRPGIGRSDYWAMSSIAEWPNVVEQVASLLHLDDFAVAGWSGGGPYALACAAAMPRRVRVVATVAGMAPLEKPRHVLELGFWLDKMLIPAARWASWAAAAVLWLTRWTPDCYLAWESRRAFGGSSDMAALEMALPALTAAIRDATKHGVRGMVDEYRRYYGSWGFDLGEVRQLVTIWQGERDTWVPMEHARRLTRLLPNSRLEVVAGASHALPLVAAEGILDHLAP